MAFHTQYSQEEILEELRRLEESKAFRRAAGLTALLRFIVEAELRGDGPLLKETILGVEVYRRAAAYDPKADGIVRVNANRLRARLKDHYHRFPSSVQILLEPGSYRPAFVVQPLSPAAPQTDSSPPATSIPAHRHTWAGWATAALLLLAVCTLLLQSYRHRQPWTQRWITHMSGMQQFPDFSPDSRQIAYAINDPGSGSSYIYMQSLKSDAPVKLTTQNRFESRPAWSPDGRSLAFIVRDPDHTVHVLVRPVNNNRETEIYAHAASGPWLCDLPRLSWSRDGSEIITTAPPSREELTVDRNQSLGCGLLAVNVATHAVRRITHSPSGMLGDLEPSISPDGKTIAFLREVSYGARDLYLVNLNGSNEHRLFDIRDEIEGLAWMPDGKGLLLCARMGAKRKQLLRLEIESGKTTVLQADTAPPALATISADGRHIAFTEYHQENKVMYLKDGRLETVFDDGTLRQHLVFSPDGSHIAYSSDRSGQNQIWVSSRDGHGEFLVTDRAEIKMTRPTWSADGRSLVFECRQNGPSGICSVNLQTRQIVPLIQTQHDAILPSLSHDGRRLYFTSNDTGEYIGYRLQLHISQDGSLSAAGRPEPMTIGGTGFLRESGSGNTLYMLGSLPMHSLLAVPIQEAPVSLSSGKIAKPGYILRQSTSIDDCSSLAEDGLLSAEGSPGSYHFYLYKEGYGTPLEIAAPPISDLIDNIAWDSAGKAVLLTTRSSPVGALFYLSK